MIVIESTKQDVSINIFLDHEGIDELIDFLNYIKKNDESLHLTQGNELEETPITANGKLIDSVKLIYVSKKNST